MIINNISVTYENKSNNVEALKNVNIELPNKGIVFITGKSGSGKTTLLHVIGNILTPTSGQVFNNPKAMTDIGFIFQENNLIDTLNVEDNIIVGSSIKDESKIDEIAKSLKINHLIFEKLNTLSGGEKQRVAIARCLYRGNNIILADEPTSSLDDSNSNNILKILKEISKDKLVIVVTHNRDLVKKYADKEIMLKDGAVEKIIEYNIIEDINKTININKHKSKLITNKIYTSNLKQMLNFTGITSFLLSLILFTSLIIFFSMIRLNPAEVGLKNSYKSKDDLIYGICHDYKKDYREEYNRTSFTENKILQVINENPNYDFYRLYNYPLLSMMYYGPIDNESLNSNERYLPLEYSSGMLEIEESDLKKLNIELIYGNFPTNYNEYLITDLQYYFYQRYGFNRDKVSINSFSDLDKIIFPGNEKFKISGVVNTYFNTNYLDILFNLETQVSDSASYNYNQDIKFILNESIHNARIVLDGFINHYYPNQIVMTNRSFNSLSASIANKDISLHEIKKDNFSQLKENEIAIDLETAIRNKIIDRLDFIFGLDKQCVISMLKFAQDNFAEIQNEFKEFIHNEDGYDKDTIDYISYYYYIYFLGEQDNIFHPGYNREYFKTNSVELDDPVILSLLIDGIEYDLKVIRVFEDDQHQGFYFSNDFYTYLNENVLSNTKTIFAKLKGNLKSDLNLFASTFDDDLIVKFSNRTIEKVNKNNVFFQVYGEYGLTSIPILLIFILLFFITIIFIRLKNSKRQIGVLLTLGYSRTKIASFYLINIISTIILAFSVSIFTSNLLISKINSILLGPITIIKYFLKVSFLNVVYPLLILLIMLTVISALVIRKVNKLDISMMVRGE